ncbi:head-tail adaptor protein [Pandoraea pneumonica]|uniref:Head-tail adaptor protein n=2 Tax=Pandoraea pneumonica TaxID=2508299 RepID=A0A5E4WX17_9BURK|nr:head-tail adaptor protein [Pandoraea pneumonica]
MRAGRLSDWVVIERRESVRDALGEQSHQWVRLDADWGDIRFVNGREYVTSGTEVSVATVSIRMRWRDDVLASDRIVDADGQVYSIAAILPDKRRRVYVDFACSTGASDG